MITLLKLGGSLITDKTKAKTFRQDVTTRAVNEIAQAMQMQEVKLIIGHGSGSFGHFAARKYNTINGVHTRDEWIGFAEVAQAAAELNHLITVACHTAEIPIFRIQPSASVVAEDGNIKAMNLANIRHAINHNLVPLLYGDVAFDEVRGGTILSTETIFSYLADNLPVSRLILVGEVDGVYDNQNNIIRHITPSNFDQIKGALGQSHGVDVTGGMLSKIRDMLAIASTPPYPSIQIINGKQAGIIHDTLLGKAQFGTLITADKNDPPVG